MPTQLPLEVYLARGWRERCACCSPDLDVTTVVVANSKSEALAMLLDTWQDTKAPDWRLDQVDLTLPHIK